MVGQHGQAANCRFTNLSQHTVGFVIVYCYMECYKQKLMMHKSSPELARCPIYQSIAAISPARAATVATMTKLYTV